MQLFRLLWSRSFLLNRSLLWTLLWVNGLGTVYGFVWYGEQIGYTLKYMPNWLVAFVPDSPTASLLFTVSILFLLLDDRVGDGGTGRKTGNIRAFVEAAACLTSFKYGIWAVVMIFAGAWRGNILDWQDWMLVVSHLGMAFEGIVYARFFTFGLGPVLLTAVWTTTNDTLDYGKGIYPWLPKELHGDLAAIRLFTVSMSGISTVLFGIFAVLRKNGDKSV